MPRFTILQTETYIVNAPTAQDAIEQLDEMDDDDQAGAYQRREVEVLDGEGNRHPVDY